MSLKVLDFYAASKPSINKLGKLLMQDALFCIMVEVRGVVKELATMVTKRYHYKEYKNKENFIPQKVDEYNVLNDFLIYSKTRIKSKWDLSEEEYQSLIQGLERCLIERYSNCGFARKVLLLGQGIFRGLISSIKRRFK